MDMLIGTIVIPLVFFFAFLLAYLQSKRDSAETDSTEDDAETVSTENPSPAVTAAPSRSTSAVTHRALAGAEQGRPAADHAAAGLVEDPPAVGQCLLQFGHTCVGDLGAVEAELLQRIEMQLPSMDTAFLPSLVL